MMMMMMKKTMMNDLLSLRSDPDLESPKHFNWLILRALTDSHRM